MQMMQLRIAFHFVRSLRPATQANGNRFAATSAQTLESKQLTLTMALRHKRFRCTRDLNKSITCN